MTNWEKYFSTPEKAAETIGDMCAISASCDNCIMKGNSEHCGDPLEWLRQDADAEDMGCADCEIDYNDKEDGG